MSDPLASLLLDLADRTGTEASRRRTFRLHGRRAEIAAKAGLTPAALQAELERLVARRAILLTGDLVTILDRAVLERAEDERIASFTGPRVLSPSPEDAVRALLADERFLAAPRTAALLAYLARKALSGETEEIDPARIGVEALGLPPDHDPSRDPTLRVLLMRLRRTLDEYYAENDRHDFKLRIPPGACRLVIQHNPARRSSGRPEPDAAASSAGDGAAASAPERHAERRTRAADEGSPSRSPPADAASDAAELIERMVDDYLLGRLVPGSVHATSNDLQIIQGAAELLAAESLPERVRRRLTLVSEAVGEAIVRTGDMRALARRGASDARRRAGDSVETLLAHAERFARLASNDTGPSVAIEARPDDPPITIPAERHRAAEQVLGCLVLLARATTPKGTTARLVIGGGPGDGDGDDGDGDGDDPPARRLVLDLRCPDPAGGFLDSTGSARPELKLLCSLVSRAGGVLRGAAPTGDAGARLLVTLPLRDPRPPPPPPPPPPPDPCPPGADDRVSRAEEAKSSTVTPRRSFAWVDPRPRPAGRRRRLARRC